MPLSINQIPTPVPSSTDPVNFSARGDAVFGAFPNFITQTNAVASEAAANRDSAEASKTAAANSETNAATYAANATTSANNASSSSVASLWVSGTTYAVNDKRVSPITGQVYRRKTAGAGTTDPSLDSTNWYAVLLDADTQYPSIKPTLNLDFANSGKLDPRITFTRASTATYFDKLGVLRTALNNEPRFDYDPVTLEAKGLLIEESRQNLILRSEDFTTAWGTTRASILSNQVIAPDGSLTADKLVEDTSNNSHRVSQSTTALVVGKSYTFSVYAKAGERSSITLYETGTTGTIRTATFNLLTGAVTGISVAGYNIQNVGNGWYRCSISIPNVTNSAGVYAYIELSTGSTVFYQGDGSSGVYLWGAQLEEGSFPTSYIPTISTPVTRQADSAIMTGTNFSSWYNQNEGTIYSEAESSNVIGTATCIASFNNGTLSERIELYSGEQSHLFIVDNSTTQVNIDLGSFTKNKFSKVAAIYSLNNFAASLDSNIATDTSGTLPLVDRLHIGDWVNYSGKLNGHIKKLAYFPKAVQPYQLQILTK